MSRWGLVFMLLFLLASCRTEPFEMGDQVDLEVFKHDRGACNNLRSSEIEDIKAAQDKILSHSEDEVLATFGRYDFQVLDSRKQKMFVYFLEPGTQCESMQSPSESLTMVVHFNAVNLAKEVTFQQGLP